MAQRRISAAVIGSAVVGALMMLAGVASFVKNLGIIGITAETSTRMYRGVVEVRHITAYLDPIPLATPNGWHDPVGHPERIVPPRPGFPWFGLSPTYQVGLFNRPDDRSVITPTCNRSAYFPIWVPALLLCAPFVGRLYRSRRAEFGLPNRCALSTGSCIVKA